MYVQSMKSLAVLGAFALMLAFSTNANAQTTVQASITTNAAITVADGVDMDYGTWFLAVNGADDFLLTMTTAGVVTASGNVTSTATNIVPAVGAGTVTVTTPTGTTNTVLQMTRSAIIDFPDAGLTFQNTTYGTAAQGANQALGVVAVPVTVATGGTPQTVSFGGQINVSATPADATHLASFTVSFAY